MTGNKEDRGYSIKKKKKVIAQDSKEDREVNIELDTETLKKVVRPWLSKDKNENSKRTNGDERERKRQMVAEEIDRWLKVNGYPPTEYYVRRWLELRYLPMRDDVVEDLMRRIEELRS